MAVSQHKPAHKITQESLKLHQFPCKTSGAASDNVVSSMRGLRERRPQVDYPVLRCESVHQLSSVTQVTRGSTAGLRRSTLDFCLGGQRQSRSKGIVNLPARKISVTATGAELDLLAIQGYGPRARSLLSRVRLSLSLLPRSLALALSLPACPILEESPQSKSKRCLTRAGRLAPVDVLVVRYRGTSLIRKCPSP